MKTDIPLKILTSTCGPDLLKLIGDPNATLLQVETIELAFSERRLDNVLHLRSPNGQEYLHVIEWLGYTDELVLWRLLLYIVQVALKFPHMTVVGTVIYLKSAYDVGDTLVQKIDGVTVSNWSLSSICLSEYEAADMLELGLPGIAVITPLMKNVSPEIIKRAIAIIRQKLPYAAQATMLSVLGVLAEPYIPKEEFLQQVRKEHLMESELLSYLLEDEIEKRVYEIEKRVATEKAALEARLARETIALEARLAQARAVLEKEQSRNNLQQALYRILTKRFPQASVIVAADIHRITQPDLLQELIVELGTTDDFGAWEQLLKETVAKCN